MKNLKKSGMSRMLQKLMVTHRRSSPIFTLALHLISRPIHGIHVLMTSSALFTSMATPNHLQESLKSLRNNGIRVLTKPHNKCRVAFPTYVTVARCSTTEFASLTKVRHSRRQLLRFIEDLAGPLVHHLR